MLSNHRAAASTAMVCSKPLKFANARERAESPVLNQTSSSGPFSYYHQRRN